MKNNKIMFKISTVVEGFVQRIPNMELYLKTFNCEITVFII